MKDILKKIRKNWITVWLIVVFLLSGAFGAFAAYRKVTSVKRVVTTQSSPKILFSSNCMLDYEYSKKIPSEQFTVTVCNYDQSDKDTVNPDEITYNFTAQLLFKLGDDYIPFSELQSKVNNHTVNITQSQYNEYIEHAKLYKIKQTQNDKTVVNGNEITFWDKTECKVTDLSSQTLTGKSQSTDKFLVTIPQADLDDPDPKFYVLVKAEPQGDSSLKPISSRLYGAKNIIVTAAWDGNLVESNTENTDYDFYNYVITGSGSGKLDIMWDPVYFYVSDFFFDTDLSGVKFYEDIKEPRDSTAHSGWKQVTIEVNSSDITDDQNNIIEGKSRYEIQLYKVKSNTPYTGDNDASKFIDCKLQNETPSEP